MILNSFSEVNASACPGAFQEVNGLTIVVPNDENSTAATGNSPPEALPPLPMPVEPDYAQGEDILLKALQSPFPSLSRNVQEQANSNDIFRYLNLAPGESDAETFSKFSAESSSSREPSLPPLASSLYQERRGISISEVCGRGDDLQADPFARAGGKRKVAGSGTASKRCKVTQSSKFCHICVRSGEQVTLVPCANVVGAVCRKAVCHKCFDKHGYNHEWAKASENREIIRQVHSGQLDRLPEHAWTCLHCRSICPQSAQCKIYARTNKRRHLILKQRKAEKDRLMALKNAGGRNFKLEAGIGNGLLPMGNPALSSASHLNRAEHHLGSPVGGPAPHGHSDSVYNSATSVQPKAMEPSPYSQSPRH